MVAEFEHSVQVRQRRVTTYGKALKKRRPKAVFTPVTASESMSDDEPVVATNPATESHRSPLVPTSKPKISSTRFKSLDGTRDTRMTAAPPQGPPSIDRKRKVSQIYKSREQSQPVSDEEPPSAPEPRRSRVSQPDIQNKEGPSARQYVPSNSMRSDAVKPRLSSPPPTPTPPRVSKPVAKPPSHVSRRVPVNVPSTKSIQKQPIPHQHPIPIHLARDLDGKAKQTNPPSARMSQEQSQRALPNKSRGSSFAKKPRKRLIDALTEQESSDDTAIDEDINDTQGTSSQTLFSHSNSANDPENQSLLETPKPKGRTPATAIRTFTRSNSALKFTYGQGRKVLEEEDDLLESLALPSDSYSRRRLDLGGPKPTPATGSFDYDDVDDGASKSPSSKLRGIHELRQAGANSRVADAMQDLVDQIGKPGASLSSRRAALLQVAEKMRDKSFARQCRDHGVDSVMLKDIGKETDTISAYLILSSLVMIMVKGSSAHLVSLLRTEQAGPAFARLLSISEDIKKVARDRKTNLSKRSQTSVISIESLLRELSIWDGNRPSFISPRNLAIKCLQLLIAQDVLIGGDQSIITDAVTKHLFQVLSDASCNSEYWSYPQTARSIELCGALSVLDVRAVSTPATQGANGEWSIGYLPLIANAFYMSLQTPAHDGKVLEDLILKLTINVTNNNLAAPDVFASKGLLPALADSISRNFNQALNLISRDAGANGIIDGLVLRLGILINFAEHSELVRQMVNDCKYENREPVKELIRLFIDNHRRTGEADSMEKTHLNVAFGYLSVLLGYLALHKPVRQKLKSSHSAKSIGPLIGSIREFIAHYEQVENAISESQDDDRPHGSYVEGLQQLVQQLEDHAARD
ncbi:hypothetical protein RRF57_006425 [Xylaria bambusicola]|uniref:Wings apart-like protein C-terminal domain-containing protein n=1 Tax=Xylaria bambusicola TaxID=326684 RepID=A0AAN7YYT9_9PEZI